MKFEVDKFYRTRNGSKVRLARVDWEGDRVFEIERGGCFPRGHVGLFSSGRFFTYRDGRFHGARGMHPMDVVEPWIEEQEKKEEE